MRFRDIIDDRKDNSTVTREDSDTQSDDSKQRLTTRGYQVLVEWAYKTTTWMDMKDVKEASPIKLVEYAVANRINQEPIFAW